MHKCRRALCCPLLYPLCPTFISDGSPTSHLYPTCSPLLSPMQPTFIPHAAHNVSPTQRTSYPPYTHLPPRATHFQPPCPPLHPMRAIFRPHAVNIPSPCQVTFMTTTRALHTAHFLHPLLSLPHPMQPTCKPHAAHLHEHIECHPAQLGHNGIKDCPSQPWRRTIGCTAQCKNI